MASFLFNFMAVTIVLICMAIVVVNGAGIIKVSFDYWFGDEKIKWLKK